MLCVHTVFEPRYLELFRALQAAPAQQGAELQFGHILAGSSAPPALMQQSVGGLPPMGVCATVKSIEELSNGRLQVRDYCMLETDAGSFIMAYQRATPALSCSLGSSDKGQRCALPCPALLCYACR
jgi:hypothetical protein